MVHPQNDEHDLELDIRMSKLRTLRSQLASLRAQRASMRLGTGYSALVIAVLWILLAIFAIDFGFHYLGYPLDALQRTVLIALGIAGLVWAAMKYTAPFLGHHETDIDMALLVERQHGIDSDLVAALQFESEEADQWGSRELEDAVVNYVAQLDRGLNVFEGISHEQFYRRMGVLVATIAVVVGLVVLLPAYAHAFVLRLALDDIHYPSNTIIERVLVNGDETLSRGIHGTSPIEANAVQGRSVVFAAFVDGDVPAEGNIRLTSSGSGGRDLSLTKVSRDDFSKVLKLMEAHLRPNIDNQQRELTELTPDERNEMAIAVASATTFDVARVEQSLKTADRYDPVLAEAWRQMKRLGDSWAAKDDAKPKEEGESADEDSNEADANRSDAAATQLFVGKLPRLLDPTEYSIRLGDAWTDDAAISMTALPVVEPRFTETAPEYARGGKDEQPNPSALQRSVIEGSQLALAVSSSKPLEEATLRFFPEDDVQAEPKPLPLVKLADDDVMKIWEVEDGQNPPTEVWQLDPAGTELAAIDGPFRYEIQVTDKDGLQLETPLRGAVRLRADRPPRISGALVHRAVLPTATPEVEIRVDDDYGIAAMNVHVTVRKGEADDIVGDIGAVTRDAGEEKTYSINQFYSPRGNLSPTAAAGRKPRIINFPLQGEDLPGGGAYRLDLSQLSLERGDQVRIVLEAIDYRGELGVAAESEPILLDITDESGILAAVSEGDRRSQEQIDDLIRRQLGIGEAP